MKKYILVLSFFLPLAIFSQGLLEESMLVVKHETLGDIFLFNQQDCLQCFYYLPANLDVSKKNDSPEVSLLTWNEDVPEKAGAILHLLIDWGLSSSVQQSIQNKLEGQLENAATLMGPVSVQSEDQPLYFFGDETLSELLNDNLSNDPLAPTTPGSKMAFSFRFSGLDVERLVKCLETIQDSQSYIKLGYRYSLISSAGLEIEKEHNLRLSLKNILINI